MRTRPKKRNSRSAEEPERVDMKWWNAVENCKVQAREISVWVTLIIVTVVTSDDGDRKSKNSKCQIGRLKGNVG